MPYLWRHQALRFESKCFMMVICLHSGYLEKLLRRTSTSPSSSSWTPWRSAWLGWVLPSEPPAAFNNTSHLKSLCCFVHRDANPLLMYLSSIAHAVLTSGRVFCEPGLHLQPFGGSGSTGGDRSQLPVWVFVISLPSDGSQIPFFGFRRGNTGFRLRRAQNVGFFFFPIWWVNLRRLSATPGSPCFWLLCVSGVWHGAFRNTLNSCNIP